MLQHSDQKELQKKMRYKRGLLMNISLKQGYDMFIFDRETYCKEKTIQNYKNTLSYFFKFMEQDRAVLFQRSPWIPFQQWM